MKRQLLITLVLLLCAFRSFSGTEQERGILVPGAAFDLSSSPLSACRYKKPFPFQCVQLIKKRLTNPPDMAQAKVFKGHIQTSSSSDDAFFCINNRLALVQPGEIETASLFFPATHWRTCGVGRNVFHPPPAAA